LLHLYPHHGHQFWMITEAFYNGLTKPMMSTIDAAAEGTLMNTTKDKAYNLIEELAVNNF